MDDIDKAKIGKREEKLDGWDHIRKPFGLHYPSMQAIRKIKKTPTPKYLQRGYKEQHDNNYHLILAVALLLIIVLVVGARLVNIL